MSTDIEKERLRLNREAAHHLCRLDEIEQQLKEKQLLILALQKEMDTLKDELRDLQHKQIEGWIKAREGRG